MKRICIYKRSVITISVIIVSVFLLTRCINKQTDTKTGENKSLFAGSAACAGCHQDIYKTHIATAHYLTSGLPGDSSILGSFVPGENSFAYNPQVAILMEKKDSGFYQVEYVKGVPVKSRRIDIVFGSGTKGQSYLNWQDDRLYQMPITYFVPAHQWSNSPGFPNRVVFNRPITSRCMECHVTNAHVLSEPGKEPEEFDHQQIIYGVDCEKCHGPGAAHIAFQQQHPADTSGQHILNPADFTRQQNLDMCALCHGGRLTKTKPSFTFKAGDKLSDYFSYAAVGADVVNIDVHGNQYGLLSASKCFTMSEMTCGSCHKPHEKERGQLTVFSQRCMNCHNSEHGKTCKKTAELGKVITQNCIDCHMPKEPSRSVAVQLQGADVPTPALMRTHFIKIYPNETKKVMDSIRKH